MIYVCNYLSLLFYMCNIVISEPYHMYEQRIYEMPLEECGVVGERRRRTPYLFEMFNLCHNYVLFLYVFM